MSFNPYSAPLTLSIKSSRLKWLIILIPHVLAAFLILVIDEFNVILTVSLTILIAISLIYFFRLHLARSLSKSVTLIQHDINEQWRISSSNESDLFGVELMPSSFVSNYISILNFKRKNSRRFFPLYTALVTKDSISFDEYRYLKVRLRTLRST